MADEWRVEVELDEERHGFSLGERLRSHSLDDEARERLGGRRDRHPRRLHGLRLHRQRGGGPRGRAGAARAARRRRALRRRLDQPLAPGGGDLEGRRRAAAGDRGRPDRRVPRPRGGGARAGRAQTGEMPFEVRVDLPKLSDALDARRRAARAGPSGRAPLAPRPRRRADRGARRRARRGAARPRCPRARRSRSRRPASASRRSCSSAGPASRPSDQPYSPRWV